MSESASVSQRKAKCPRCGYFVQVPPDLGDAALVCPKCNAEVPRRVARPSTGEMAQTPPPSPPPPPPSAPAAPAGTAPRKGDSGMRAAVSASEAKKSATRKPTESGTWSTTRDLRARKDRARRANVYLVGWLALSVVSAGIAVLMFLRGEVVEPFPPSREVAFAARISAEGSGLIMDGERRGCRVATRDGVRVWLLLDPEQVQQILDMTRQEPGTEIYLAAKGQLYEKLDPRLAPDWEKVRHVVRCTSSIQFLNSGQFQATPSGIE